MPMKINLKFTFLCMIVCCFSATVDAQISGRVIDGENGGAIEYATVGIYSSADSSFINGVVTNADGRFSMDDLREESVYLQAQFMGYQMYESEALSAKESLDLGDIALTIGSIALSEVEIAARKMSTIQKVDKQVYSADQYQNAAGGSATDVLRNLPAVSVNSFGEISVRGTQGFLMMINGRAVQSDPAIILQQLSANVIENIEIITAPSAKYDPDGNAGIINITTKKGLDDGVFVKANVLAGLPSVEAYDNRRTARRYGADLNVNVKQNRWDLSAGLDYRRYDRSGRREGYVNTLLGNVLTELPSDGERSFNEENYAARLSAQYSPNERQTWTVGMYAGKRTKERTADILYLDQQRTLIPQDELRDPTSYYTRYLQTEAVFGRGDVINQLTFFNENLRVRKGDFLIGSIDFEQKLGDGSQLSFSGLYERTILGGPTDNVSLAFPGLSQVLQLQFNENDNPLDGIRLQMDYKKPIGELDWEVGYQYRYLKHPGDFSYFDRDLVNDVWIENPLFTNSINLSRSIHSVYNQLSGNAGPLSYIAGIRLEYFDRHVDIARPDESFTLDQFNIFPSLTFGYRLAEGLTAKLAYSRRIERTTTFKMTPFPEREHSETLEQGDAELQPEYIDIIEAGLAYSWDDHSAFANVYYRGIDNVINRVNTVFNDTILNRIYTNAGQATAVGLEMGTTVYPHANLGLSFGANVFTYQIEGDLFGDEIDNSTIQYSMNANANLRLSSSFKAQLALNYLSERITAQGVDSRFYNPSLTLNKSFSNGRYTVGLQWLNMDLGLLQSNEQRITTARETFYTTTNYVYEVDILQLNFSYQLNQPKTKVKLPQSEFGKKEF